MPTQDQLGISVTYACAGWDACSGSRGNGNRAEQQEAGIWKCARGVAQAGGGSEDSTPAFAVCWSLLHPLILTGTSSSLCWASLSRLAADQLPSCGFGRSKAARWAPRPSRPSRCVLTPLISAPLRLTPPSRRRRRRTAPTRHPSAGPFVLPPPNPSSFSILGGFTDTASGLGQGSSRHLACPPRRPACRTAVPGRGWRPCQPSSPAAAQRGAS